MNKKGRVQNLIPCEKGKDKFTPEKRREIASLGGKAMNAKRRKKRDLQEAMKTILEMAPAGKTREMLKDLGYDPDDQSNADAIAATLFAEAMLGDKKSMEMLLQYFFQANDDKRKTVESNARVQALSKNGVDVSVTSGDDDGGLVIYLPKIEDEEQAEE